jgi:hypothetical protein
MKPSIGRIVTFKGHPSNGSYEHPAMVTRVWSPNDPADGASVHVNLTVFLDNDQPILRSSVPMFETRERADKSGWSPVCFWPDRV